MSPKRVHLALALRELRCSPEPDEDVAPYDRSGWAVWRGTRIPFWNHLPAAWEPRVIELLAAFAPLLKGAPPFDYRRLAEIRCEALPPRLLGRRGITVCIADDFDDDEVAARVDPLVARDHVMLRAVIRLRSRTVPGVDPLCHELMHALTGIDDLPDDGNRFPLEDSSCVRGFLSTPGAFDRQFLRWAHRQYARYRQPKAPKPKAPRSRE